MVYQWASQAPGHMEGTRSTPQRYGPSSITRSIPFLCQIDGLVIRMVAPYNSARARIFSASSARAAFVLISAGAFMVGFLLTIQAIAARKRAEIALGFHRNHGR